MDSIFIGCVVGGVLLVYLVGYFTGKSKANKEFIKMLLKYSLKKKKVKPEGLEYGKK